MFVNRIVEDLKNTMVQPAFIGRPNVHAGTLPNACKPLQLVNL
jgi:hypothetical protein